MGTPMRRAAAAAGRSTRTRRAPAVRRKPKRDYIRLDVSKNGQVVVIPENEDRFMTTVQEAAEACKESQKWAAFHQQFKNGLLPKLGQWLSQYDDKVDRAFIGLRDGGLLFLVTRKAVRFDGKFTNSLAKLDIAVACDAELDLISMEMLALPQVDEDAVWTFLDRKSALELRRAE